MPEHAWNLYVDIRVDTASAVVLLFLATCCKEWSGRVDSNHRPPDPEEIGLQAPYIQRDLNSVYRRDAPRDECSLRVQERPRPFRWGGADPWT
jgi:hypothetical protein